MEIFPSFHIYSNNYNLSCFNSSKMKSSPGEKVGFTAEAGGQTAGLFPLGGNGLDGVGGKLPVGGNGGKFPPGGKLRREESTRGPVSSRRERREDMHA